jgi:hypothetical protein
MTKTERTPHPIKHKVGTPKYNLSISGTANGSLTLMAQQMVSYGSLTRQRFFVSNDAPMDTSVRS